MNYDLIGAGISGNKIYDLYFRFEDTLYTILRIKTGVLTRDGVHLNDTGNQLVADEMWKVISKL